MGVCASLASQPSGGRVRTLGPRSQVERRQFCSAAATFRTRPRRATAFDSRRDRPWPCHSTRQSGGEDTPAADGEGMASRGAWVSGCEWSEAQTESARCLAPRRAEGGGRADERRGGVDEGGDPPLSCLRAPPPSTRPPTLVDPRDMLTNTLYTAPLLRRPNKLGTLGAPRGPMSTAEIRARRSRSLSRAERRAASPTVITAAPLANRSVLV